MGQKDKDTGFVVGGVATTVALVLGLSQIDAILGSGHGAPSFGVCILLFPFLLPVGFVLWGVIAGY